MNNVYRVIWNAAKATWQVVGELGSRRGKERDQTNTTRTTAASRTLLSGALILVGPAALGAGLPGGGQITHGEGSLSASHGAMTISQSSDRMAISWDSFSIGENATVEFLQPTATAIALNRVLGSDVSQIQGALKANGRVFLINPNGVLFSESAMVDVGGLVASTLDISDEDFASGRYVFEGDSAAAVVNRGAINAEGGFVAMIAARVENVGSITADSGAVLMGAGSRVRLDLGGPVKLEVEEAVLDALIEQGGAIRADGGTILLTAKAAGELTSTVINHTGISEARTLTTGENGEILLLGDGAVQVAGTLDASAPHGGQGGFVETSGATVLLSGEAHVTTLSSDGTAGTWLIDPTDLYVQTSCVGVTSTCIETNTINIALGFNNMVFETYSHDTGSDAGDIFINNDLTYTGTRNASLHFRAHRDINIDSDVSLSATNASLTTILQSNHNGQGGGRISMGAGASIFTNGGHLVMTGGVVPLLTDDPLVSDLQAARSTGHAQGREGAVDGISIGAGATLDTRVGQNDQTGGDIVLRGRAYSATDSEGRALSINGTSDSRVSVNAGSGSLELHNDGNNNSSAVRINHADLTGGNDSFALAARSRFGTGLEIHGSSFNFGAGGLTLDGRRVGTAGGSGMGLDLRNASIDSAGSVVLTGQSVAGDAVHIQNSDVSVTGDAAITVTGSITHSDATGKGVSLSGNSNVLQSGSGDISVIGNSRRDVGLAVDGYRILSGAGSVSLWGERAFNASANVSHGLTLSDAEVRTGSGNITIDGRTNHGSRTGLVVSASADVLSQSGTIRLEGRNTGSSTQGDWLSMQLDGRIGAAPDTAVEASSSDIILLANQWSVGSEARAQSTGDLVIGRTSSGGVSIGNYALNNWLRIPVAFLENRIHGFGRIFLGGSTQLGVNASAFRVQEAVTLQHNAELLTTGTFQLVQDLTTAHDLGIGHAATTSESQKYQIFSGRSITLTAPSTQTFRLGAFNNLDSFQYNLISTAGQLQEISGDLGGLHALANDIDGIGALTALGNTDTPFSGTFAGLGHTLSGYSIDGNGQDNQGLFGVIDSAVIRNLRVNGSSVSGGDHVGLLVGRAIDSQILSSRIEGGEGSTVNGHLRVGGMIGSASGSDVVSQSSEWSVTVANATVNIAGSADNAGGGLVGAMEGGTLSSVTTSNTVNANGEGASDIGGLVGRANDVHIGSSSSSATLVTRTGQERIGGLVGRQIGGGIVGSHASGVIETSIGLAHVGGLVGHSIGGSISQSYRNALDVSGHQLDRIGGLVGWSEGGTISASFLNGQLTASGWDVGGLVGFNDGGLIHNESHLRAGVTVSNSTNVGGLAGMNTGTIQDSFVQYAVWNNIHSGSNPERSTRDIALTVTDGGSMIGGLVGWNAGTIVRSYADMTVNAGELSTYVGGLVGVNATDGLIDSSYFLSLAESDNSTIVGGGRGLSGGSYVGGLAGFNLGTIRRSYSAASVNGIGSNVGGLVGYNDSEADVIASFWDMGVQGAPQTSSAGTGLSTEDMMRRQTFIDAGWSLSNIGGDGTTWRIFDDSDMYDADAYTPQTRPMLRTFMRSYTVGRSWSIEYDGDDHGWIDGPVSGIQHTNQIYNPVANNQIYGEGVLGRMDDSGFEARDAGTYALEFNGAYYSHQHGYDISYAQNATQTITPRRIYIQVTGAEDKVYDATNIATVTVNASRSNLGGSTFINGDDVSFNFNGGGTFATSNVGSNINVSVNSGNFALTGADGANYTILGVLGHSTTANITPAQVTAIGGVSVSAREYDGTRDVSAFDLSDLTITVNGIGALDPQSALYQLLVGQLQIDGEAQYGSANAGTYTLSIGSGDISLLTSNSPNFGLDLSGGFSVEGATITPRALVFVGGDFSASKIYDGTTAIEEEHLGGEFQFDGLVGDESLAFSLVEGNFGYVNVGIYNNVVLVLNVDAVEGTTASNYRIGSSVLGEGTITLNGMSGTITPRELTVMLTESGQFTVADRVYDGTTAAQITNSSGLALDGLVGDEYFLIVDAGAAFSQSDAGEGIVVNLDSLNLGSGFNGALAMNYTLSLADAPSTTATITPRPVQVTANDASRVYGESNPALTYSAESAAEATGARGLLEGDALSGGLATSATAASNVGGYAITEGSLANANYIIEFADGLLTITPRPVQVAASAADKVYGDADPALGYTVETQSEGRGLVEGDSLDGSLTRASGENVGSHAITQGTLTDAANPNYTIDFTGADLQITQRAITLAAELVSRIYGESDPQLSVSISGGSLASGSVTDTLEDVVGALSRVFGEDVGQYHVLLGEGVSADNYAITFDADNGAFSITPRPVQVTAQNASRIYGESNPTLDYSAESAAEATGARGLLEGDALSGDLATTATTGSGVGDYDITQGALANANYTIEFTDGMLTITPRPVQVTANDASRVYGESNPALTYSAESAAEATGARGLLEGDALSGDLVTTATAASDVGGFAITQGTLADAANPNYIIEFADGLLTITPRPVQVAANDASRVYGESNPALSFSTELAAEATGARGLLDGDTLSGELATTATAASDVGGHAITEGSLANANYTIEFIDGTLTITPRPVTVIASNADRLYGEANPLFEVGVESVSAGRGLLDGDALSGSAVTQAGTGSNVGAYDITEGSLANPNYLIEFVNGTLTITPRPVQVAASDASKTYGDHDPLLDYTAEAQSEGRGLLEGDSLDGALTRAAGEDVDSYAISQGTLANANYQIEFTGAQLEITQRAIELAADLVSRVYGESDPTLSVSIVNGSLGSESVSDTLVELVGALTRVAGEDVGAYAVLLGEGVKAGNYAITFDADNSAFSITPRPVQVAANDASRVYGGQDPAFSHTVEAQSEGRGLLAGESLAVALSRAAGENVGSYAITPTTPVDASNPNYLIEFVDGQLQITPLPITVGADDKGKIYGQADPALTWRIVNGQLLGDDQLSGTLTRPSGELVGRYAITQGTLGNPNYLVQMVDGTLVIRPQQQSEILPDSIARSTALSPRVTDVRFAAPEGGATQSAGLILINVSDDSVNGAPGTTPGIGRDRNGQTPGGFMPVLVVNGGIQLPAGVDSTDDSEREEESL